MVSRAGRRPAARSRRARSCWASRSSSKPAEGTTWTSAPQRPSRSMLPVQPTWPSAPPRRTTAGRPRREAAETACWGWFDCAMPLAITTSAPLATAAPRVNSSMRYLLPPRPNPARSSRLSQTSGPPRAEESRGAATSAVGSMASGPRGKPDRPSPAEFRVVKHAQGLRRYAPLLPLRTPDALVTLGEGGTPVISLSAVGRQLGVDNLSAKLEYLNPTGAFKDRGNAVQVTVLKEL